MRVLARIGATLIILVGVVAVAAAVVAMKTVGRNNIVDLDPRRITTTRAVVTSGHGLLGFYDTTLIIKATAVDPRTKLWIGIAHQDDLDSYLDDEPRAEIISYRYPDEIGIRDVKGTARGLPRPTGMDWWVASAQGTGSAQLSWPMRNGPYGVVIMNQSGDPRISVDATFAVQIKGIFETAELVGLGGVVAIGAGVLIFVLTRRRRRTGAAELSGTSVPPATGGPGDVATPTDRPAGRGLAGRHRRLCATAEAGDRDHRSTAVDDPDGGSRARVPLCQSRSGRLEEARPDPSARGAHRRRAEPGGRPHPVGEAILRQQHP